MEAAAKRTMDIMVAAAILLISVPLLVLAALGIKLTDGGPILYRQIRVGKNGSLFWMLKFRSMVLGAEAQTARLTTRAIFPCNPTFKMKEDPRVTWVGKWLRKTSVDELPQLWNVLKGEMSLVGPRPPLPAEVRHYGMVERGRLSIVPGMTGLWQVNGRSDLPFSTQVALDLAYIRNRSLGLDIKIMFQTIPAVILGRGAY